LGFAGSDEGGEGVRRLVKGEEAEVEGSGEEGFEGESG